MTLEEKYGGILSPALRDGDTVLSERYLTNLDVVTLFRTVADMLI
jgi:hypothetical protein